MQSRLQPALRVRGHHGSARRPGAAWRLAWRCLLHATDKGIRTLGLMAIVEVAGDLQYTFSLSFSLSLSLSDSQTFCKARPAPRRKVCAQYHDLVQPDRSLRIRKGRVQRVVTPTNDCLSAAISLKVVVAPSAYAPQQTSTGRRLQPLIRGQPSNGAIHSARPPASAQRSDSGVTAAPQASREHICGLHTAE